MTKEILATGLVVNSEGSVFEVLDLSDLRELRGRLIGALADLCRYYIGTTEGA